MYMHVWLWLPIPAKFNNGRVSHVQISFCRFSVTSNCASGRSFKNANLNEHVKNINISKMSYMNFQMFRWYHFFTFLNWSKKILNLGLFFFLIVDSNFHRLHSGKYLAKLWVHVNALKMPFHYQHCWRHAKIRARWIGFLPCIIFEDFGFFSPLL